MHNTLDRSPEPVYLVGQGQITLEIEKLVNDIKATFKPIALSRSGFTESAYFDGMFFIRLKNSLNRYFTQFSPHYQYSPHLNVFWQACRDIGLWPEGQGLMTRGLYQVTMDHIIGLVRKIAEYSRSKQFDEAVKRRHYQVRENQRSLRNFASHIHDHYARVLLIRVDLSYKPEFYGFITIDDVLEHRSSFFRRKEYHPVFNHLVAHAWAVEQGNDTGGFHIHAAFYFRGDRRQYDWAIGKDIGELWEQVTGHGRYFNCNTPKHKEYFRQRNKLGIGMIHRDRPLEVQNGINTTTYLTDPTKQDQHLRVQPIQSRVFGSGCIAALRKDNRHV
ncbi:hypothetical protein [Aquirhabdus sp.]|uniref:hypothetical protein n=1 Tax=Aquirhabdus sp. TaxID=2824160 RepID=UPI00396CB922